MELTIGIQNKEITEAGTLIITMNPVNNAKWISTPDLIEAEIAVQPYGVLSIPNYEALGSTELMCYVTLNYVTYGTGLANLIAGSIGDEITFAAPYLNLGDLQDVNITSVTNGQALIYNTSSGKWKNGSAGATTLNGLNNVNITTPTDGQVLTYDSTASKWKNADASGGDPGYTYQEVTLVDDETVTMSGGEGHYSGLIATEFTLVEGDFYQITIDETSFIAKATSNNGALMCMTPSGMLGVGIMGANRMVVITSESAVSSADVTLVHYVLTLTDGFKKAVNDSTIILEADGTGSGTALAPYGLTGFDETTAAYLVQQNVLIHDESFDGYFLPIQTLDTSNNPIGFAAITSTSPLTLTYFGYYDSNK